MRANNRPALTSPTLPPDLLEPHPGVLVISEEAEMNLLDAHLSLDAIAWMLETAASANIKLRNAGQEQFLIELPPESLAGLLRTIHAKIEPHTNNPPLSRLRAARPDLFAALEARHAAAQGSTRATTTELEV